MSLMVPVLYLNSFPVCTIKDNFLYFFIQVFKWRIQVKVLFLGQASHKLGIIIGIAHIEKWYSPVYYA